MTNKSKLKIGQMRLCGQPTKLGRPCRVEVRKAGQFCWRHRTMKSIARVGGSGVATLTFRSLHLCDCIGASGHMGQCKCSCGAYWDAEH